MGTIIKDEVIIRQILIVYYYGIANCALKSGRILSSFTPIRQNELNIKITSCGYYCRGYIPLEGNHMKATGIVRRIDDLGRVVIPKEIRRTMRIREGDPLEIYTDKDGEVIFKKYSPMGELSEFAGQICETLNKTTGNTVAVTDRDTVIAAAGPGKRELIDRRISQELEKIMEGRQIFQHVAGVTVPAVEGSDKIEVSIAAPIISEGDIMGCVVFVGGPMGETEYKLAQTISGFLGKQMEG
jgi:AbrB family transcriptional regulator (stage V sporulation protein T)